MSPSRKFLKNGVFVLAAMAPCVLNAQTVSDTASATQTATGTDATAAQSENVVQMSTVNIYAPLPANDTPSVGFATAVTELRFDPEVDIQSRGFAETQSDVVIRGGTFENTGFKIGAVNLMDPQTGHYSSELPIDPMMLSTPTILTGVDNAFAGLNASVGTVQYNWLPIATAGTAEIGAGTDSLFFSRFVNGWKSADNAFLGRTVAVQVSSAYSVGDGTPDASNFRFQRYGFRTQLSGQDGQTDLYLGYQKKNYVWPGMYTGSRLYDEGDKYETALLMLNHTQNYGDDSHWSFGAYSRQFLDDYDLKRSNPSFYRPYRHETKVSDAAVEGEHKFGDGWSFDWRAEAAADSIRSTDLTYGNFMSRSYFKGSSILGKQLPFAGGSILLQGGETYDYTNRDADVGSPLARITYDHNLGEGVFTTYAEYSRATEVDGYTALNSNPGVGSFSGNADLPRERADNHEVGASWKCKGLKFGGSLFYRNNLDLTDWTYDDNQPRIFRKAYPMDLTVRGIETYTSWDATKALSFTLGYAFLDTDANYHQADVDASFYAMNYPRHRATLSSTWKILDNLELRMDAEAREQEQNSRRTSGNDAFIADASLDWTPGWVKGMTFSLLADNITNCGFEDFPGSPAEGREIAGRVSYTW